MNILIKLNVYFIHKDGKSVNRGGSAGFFVRGGGSNLQM